MRRVLALLAVVVLVVVVVIGLTQADESETPEANAPKFDLSAAKRQLAGAPEPLASLHAQANELLPGGKDAFRRRLAELEGHPVVVNKWASWCVPCQAEFPIFESVGTKRGKEVAFLGVNGTDKDPAARRFLDKRPLPFPSYTDPGEDIARDIEAPKNYPMTVFIGRDGKTAYIHSGPYRSDAQLDADIDKYL
jgi:thiol-disulfide isomerase/thioredoxin